MTSDQIGMIVRELDKLTSTVEGVDEKVDDVRDRVTVLEAQTRLIGRLIGLLIAGVPVLFLIMDRLSSG